MDEPFTAKQWSQSKTRFDWTLQVVAISSICKRSLTSTGEYIDQCATCLYIQLAANRGNPKMNEINEMQINAVIESMH